MCVGKLDKTLVRVDVSVVSKRMAANLEPQIFSSGSTSSSL